MEEVPRRTTDVRGLDKRNNSTGLQMQCIGPYEPERIWGYLERKGRGKSFRTHGMTQVKYRGMAERKPKNRR